MASRRIARVDITTSKPDCKLSTRYSALHTMRTKVGLLTRGSQQQCHLRRPGLSPTLLRTCKPGPRPGPCPAQSRAEFTCRAGRAVRTAELYFVGTVLLTFFQSMSIIHRSIPVSGLAENKQRNAIENSIAPRSIWNLLAGTILVPTCQNRGQKPFSRDLRLCRSLCFPTTSAYREPGRPLLSLRPCR